jgi:hypothetical protein
MRAFRSPAALLLALILVFMACATPKPPLFPDIVPGEPPPPDSVDAVLLIVGDAGEVVEQESPLLHRLQQEIEVWSDLIGRDSAVTVLFLGDNVYPDGVRDRTHAEFARDSTILWTQIDLLNGPKARARGTIGFFLAGNHDWGNMTGDGGLQRLKNMEEQIHIARRWGIPVEFAPPAGKPGPVVRDIRENTRLLMIDTHLFLQERSLAARTAFIVGIENAIKEAGDRHVLIAAHHPFASAGPHGAPLTPLTSALGLEYLLQKSGTLVQDLNSPIYSALRSRLKDAFARTRRPLAFIGGHDHSLQVHAGATASDPQYILVSGAGSKSTALMGADSLRYGTSQPGFMSIIFRKEGAVDLFVIAGRDSETAKRCPPPENDGKCLEEETQAFGVMYSERLAFVKPPDTTDALLTTRTDRRDTARVR